MSLPTTANATEQRPVAFSARAIEGLICAHINVALPAEQIESLDVDAEYIQPLIFKVEKHYLDESILYNLLACHLFFTHASESGPPSKRRLMSSRALVSVLIAEHIAHDLEPDELAKALIYEFYPLNQGELSASLGVPAYLRASALELAVETQARSFLKEPPIAKIIQELWDGVLVVEKRNSSLGNNTMNLSNTITSIRHVKHSRSPSYHHVLQLISAAAFLVLYLVLIQQNPQHPDQLVEACFGLWACGYALSEYNQLIEFGTRMYFMSLWNCIDVILVCHSILYFIVRFISKLFPHAFPRSFMVARGILVTAGLFIVPRLFSVFDNNKVFSNMIFSLQRVSTDLLVSWFVVMMFSVGVWVSVAFSVPRVRLNSINSSVPFVTESDEDDNGGARTALAMFKMLFGDNDSLWDRWFEYTSFDKVALGFYLVLAQFVMPTVVTAVLATSFANIKEDSEEQFYYMRAIQTLQKLKSHRKLQASSYEVAPFNVVSWLFEWLRYVLPRRVYDSIASFSRAAFHFPGKVAASLADILSSHFQRRADLRASARKRRLEDEVDRTIGGSSSASGRAQLGNSERRIAKYALVNEVFTNEKVTQAFKNSTLYHQLEREEPHDTNRVLLARIEELEKTNATIEALVRQLLDK